MEKHQPIEFSLEQEFNLKVFETQIENLDLEQAKNLLCELYRQMSIREIYFRNFVKHNLIGDPPPWSE